MTKHSRLFSTWSLVALVVGNAVGAGIYTTSGFALADLGSREWVLFGWFVAGLVAIAGAMSYGMLVRHITESGGEYVFLSRAIHPLAGFIAGWVSLLAGFPGAIAFAALAFEAYLSSAWPWLQQVPATATAIAVTVCAGLLHGFRVRTGVQSHQNLVLLMLIILVLLVVAATFVITLRTPPISVLPVAPVQFNLYAFAGTLVWISLSYSGFNAAAYVAGEVDHARDAVPRGMVLGTVVTMVLCLAVNWVLLYGADASLIQGRAEIAAVVADSLGGRTARQLVQLVVAISLLTSITAMALAGPRVYAKMAEDGALPAVFKQRLGHPPRTSIALQVVISVLLISLSDLRGLMSYLGFTLSLCLALAVSSLFVIHWRRGLRPASAWYPLAPLVFVVCTVSFAMLSSIHQPMQALALVPVCGLGALAYYGSVRHTRRRSPQSKTEI
ncbi:amino acid permease [Arenicella chitinivorans]|uniref:Amino acid permease n=1 Tax=Arenicella chitinivorans TaxID=1329800 RepID=A0A918S213_9GAMM|nr:APC family permease [Arenicella chitinivorans]GHA19937.1 amino acid permease [Arenicella chitinivorans]